MKLNLCLFTIMLFIGINGLHSQENVISRVEPPNWWVGMKHTKLQLLVYGENVGDLKPSIDYPGITLERVIQVENPNYLFIDLDIEADAQPGDIEITFSQLGQQVTTYDYPLWAREKGSAERAGFDNTDVLYLITPDRFVNGDPSNDQVAGLQEAPDRSFIGGRHGGDIAGLEKSLSYIKELGFTALWLNPLLENDQPKYSYHGYSTTDYYKVDSRFGSNESYRALNAKAKEMGVKMIMDMIVNHCGSEHWWMKDLPSEDWVNFPEANVFTNHRKTVIQDPHVSKIDYSRMVDGWFVKTMPDLNQRNPLMANYLTQNSIWWIEYAHLAGIRMDTYPYPDMDYMTEWTRRVMLEYPHFNVVGEEWNGNPAIVAYWQRDKQNPNGYTSYLKSLMDFPLQEAMRKALTNEEGFNTGWIELYQMLANDFQYAHPEDLVVFPDNHDMDRFFAQVGQDFAKFKLGITYVMTTRGVPQVYYGTEILMDGAGDHGIIRTDFPGGWEGDPINAFTGKGLTGQQKEAQAFFKKLLHWRQTATPVHFGKMMHYVPQNGVYVYFRYHESGKVMVVLNKNEAEQTLALDRFVEMLAGYQRGTSVLTGEIFDLTQSELTIPGGSPLILDLE